MSNILRRRGRSRTQKLGTNAAIVDGEEEEDVTNMMDTDDQDILVESLEKEAFLQTQQFQRFFGFAGGFAALSSLVFPLLCQEECSFSQSAATTCWFHATAASGTHGLCVFLSRRDPRPQDRPFVLLTLFFIITPIIFWLNGNFGTDIEYFHFGLMLGNAVTFVGSMLLRWDVSSTKRALEELHGAKYEHKSL